MIRNKNIWSAVFSCLTLFSFLFSCQRQLHFDETPAEATLNKDAAGGCKPVIIGGTFKKNKNLADTNFIVVEVNVTKTGTYSMRSDTVNGYWFSANGKFDNTGDVTVKMSGHGKPFNSGNDEINIHLNSSTCSVTVPVADGAVGSFSFLGAPNACSGAVVSGTYIKGVQMTSANTATVQVYVTSPGSYSFSSNLVNGYQFSSSGNLPNYGNQTITLTASGSPANTGVDVFTLNAGFSSCTIVDTVVEASSGNNHFPIKRRNKWVYDDLSSAGDSVVRKFQDTALVAGGYNLMKQTTRFGDANYYFRSDADGYFDQGSVDRYTTTVSYSPAVIAEIPFLKEGLSTNDAWNSPNYTGVATFGQTILIRYTFQCLNANASDIVNAQLYTHVYEIQMRPQIASVGGSFGPTGEVYTLYYANDIGLIYLKKTLQGNTQMEWQLRRWEVY